MRELLGFWGGCLLIVAVAVLVFGCVDEPIDATSVIRASSQNAIFEVELSDGTRCAVLDGYQSGGISCDWESTR